MNALAGCTADQWGMVTTAQANAAGVDNVTLARLVDVGLLDHVRRGVYAAATAAEDPLRQQKAAWLQLNPTVAAWHRPRIDPDGGVLSHSSAALIHGVGDLLAGPIEFTVPRRRTTKHQDIRFRRADLAESDVTVADGLPVTTVGRTIDDLLADHIDGGHAGDLIYQALRRGQVDTGSLTNRIGRHARRYGVSGGDGPALLEFLLAQANRTPPDAIMTLSPAVRAQLRQFARDAVDSPRLRETLAAIPENGRMQPRPAEALATSPEIQRLQARISQILQTGAAAAVQESMAIVLHDLALGHRAESDKDPTE